jgi:hypothetical protein
MDRILDALSYFSVEELWEILVALSKKKKNGEKDNRPPNGEVKQ